MTTVEQPKRPTVLKVVTVLAMIAGIPGAALPLFWLGLSDFQWLMFMLRFLGFPPDTGWQLPTPTVQTLLLAFIVGAGMQVSAQGLWRRKWWAFGLTLICAIGGLGYYIKLALPVFLKLDWSHRDAGKIARTVFFYEGIPCLILLVTIGLLFLPATRRALAAPTRRPTKRVAARRAERSAD